MAIQNSRWSPILRGAENAIRWHILDFQFQSIGDQGRLHAEKDSAIADPPSLTDLRKRCEPVLASLEDTVAVDDRFVAGEIGGSRWVQARVIARLFAPVPSCPPRLGARAWTA